MAHWIEGFDPNRIVQKIEEDRAHLAIDGQELDPFKEQEYSTLLYSILGFTPEIPEVEKRTLIDRALKITGEAGQITQRAVLANISRLENEYLARSPVRYSLITSISLTEPPSATTKRVQGSVISFGQRYCHRYMPARNWLLNRVRGVGLEARGLADSPDYYLPIRVNVDARSVEEAANTAIESLDFLRGIYNWGLNRSRPSRIHFGPPSPFNKITLGTFHTLHYQNGSLATEAFWYEPGLIKNLTLFNIREVDARLTRFEKMVRKRLSKCAYEKHITEAIVRYGRALDETDLDVAFLDLWSIIEKLTNFSSGSYDATIRRAAFLFRDTQYQLQLLRQLRQHRNQFVHSRNSDMKVDVYVFTAKAVVERLLEFHLSAKLNFPDIQKASEFLDLSPDLSVLSERLDLLKHAYKFRS